MCQMEFPNEEPVQLKEAHVIAHLEIACPVCDRKFTPTDEKSLTIHVETCLKQHANKKWCGLPSDRVYLRFQTQTCTLLRALTCYVNLIDACRALPILIQTLLDFTYKYYLVYSWEKKENSWVKFQIVEFLPRQVNEQNSRSVSFQIFISICNFVKATIVEKKMLMTFHIVAILTLDKQ